MSVVPPISGYQLGEMQLIVSVLIGMALDLAGAKPTGKYYASKYDHIDVGTILNNRRMVNYYSACLLSQGACPPEGVELKSKSKSLQLDGFLFNSVKLKSLG